MSSRWRWQLAVLLIFFIVTPDLLASSLEVLPPMVADDFDRQGLCACNALETFANQSFDIELLPYRRTGNFFVAVNWLLDISNVCGFSLKLPVFMRGWNGTSVLIRSAPKALNVSAAVSVECNRLKKKHTVQGIWSAFVQKGKKYGNLKRGVQALPDATHLLKMQCVRKWLNVCSDQCRSHWKPNVLVLHIRQDDIFRENFNPNVHKKYGQPPLSYYVRAMTFQQWDMVHVIAQNTSHKSPIFMAIEILQNFSRSPIMIHQRSWPEDMCMMLCSYNFIASHSSLSLVWRAGLARRYFTSQCPPKILPDLLTRHYYEIKVNPGYKPTTRHDNSAENWVHHLLHQAQGPYPCSTGQLSSRARYPPMQVSLT
ncbi:MAG: hypothetical protein J3K34DRAFT_446616 [Monoraphidium minutum]|nr:MAG: hypothetical protein J3K34DRAFT_446616 [Monoraphidium minutum]